MLEGSRQHSSGCWRESARHIEPASWEFEPSL